MRSCYALLYKKLGDIGDKGDSIAALATTLDHIPLALVQAGLLRLSRRSAKATTQPQQPSPASLARQNCYLLAQDSFPYTDQITILYNGLS